MVSGRGGPSARGRVAPSAQDGGGLASPALSPREIGALEMGAAFGMAGEALQAKALLMEEAGEKSLMAASGEEMLALEGLSQETTCPLCLDFFKQPMVLACGHNFCRDCLAQLGAEAPCPQCRVQVEPGSAHSNQSLANITCLVKKLQLSGGAQEENNSCQLCQEHQQPLQNFCSNEKSLLCSECLEGHQGHRLLSLPEAAQEYKDLLDVLLEPLRKEGRQLLQQKQAEEQSKQERQEQFAAEKQKLDLVFKSLLELLLERQPLWGGWLAEQEEKMEAEWGRGLAQLSGEASRLQQLISQTERKCCQPEEEFLQDIQDTVDRCKGYMMGHIESVSPRLRGQLRSVLEKNASVRGMLERFKASLQTILTRENLEQLLAMESNPQAARSPKVYVTINSSTAHPRLMCQRSSVTWANIFQDLQEVPERFIREFCVLGSEGFTTAWHWWDVSVLGTSNGAMQGKVCWAIGVAKESVPRKGCLQLSSQEGIWALGKNNVGEMIAFSKTWERMNWGWSFRRLRVRLDYDAGEVEFLNAETEASLYTLRTGPFLGERVLPFFYLGQVGITLQCEARP